MSATTGIRPRRNGVDYCASKAGLLQLTKCLTGQKIIVDGGQFMW